MTRNIKAKSKAADKTFFVTALNDVAHAVYERGEDGYLRIWHDGRLCKEAADRLRADLEAKTCPLPLTTPSGSHDPTTWAAQAYDLATRIAPHIGTDDQAWLTALRIADARPWESHPLYDIDDEIPF